MLKRADDWAGDIATAGGLQDLTERLSSGAGMSIVCHPVVRVPAALLNSLLACWCLDWAQVAPNRAEWPQFLFSIRGCPQLMLGDSSFNLKPLHLAHPVEPSLPRFEATLDPASASCFSHEREVSPAPESLVSGVIVYADSKTGVATVHCAGPVRWCPTHRQH